MTPAEAHARFEEIVARAMRAPDPAEALARASRNRRLPAELRKALSRAADDGARIAGLLVAKLRFERLLRGSPEAEAWFERDPAGFAAAFRRYHEAVPLTSFFPPAEARAFQRWAESSRSATVAP